MPTLGWIRLKEYGYIPRDAVVKSRTISQRAGRYFVSALCEIEEKKNVDNAGIGIDLGIKESVVCSNGEMRKLEKKLKREQCSLSRKYKNIKKRGEETSIKERANIDKNFNRVRKLHARLTNIRLEYTVIT